MKQSFSIIFVQLINVIFGFYITIYIASNVEPTVYSVFVIYQVIITFMAAFSFMGHETHLIRNLLHWESYGCHNKIRLYISKAIFSRLLMCVLLFFPACLYVFYLTNTTYESQESSLFYLFVVSGCFVSISQSISLILRALDKYIISVVVNILGMLVIKLSALFIFSIYGFNGYLIVLVVGSFLICLVSLFIIRTHISYKLIRFKYLFEFKRRKAFIFSAYIQYLIGYSDRLILSFFLMPEILASYNLAKQIQEMAKMFIEGFFDPLTQKFVAYKSNKVKLNKYLTWLNKVRGFVILLSLIVISLLLINISFIVNYVGLNSYENFKIFVALAAISSFIYICYKVELNYNALMITANRLLKYNVNNLLVLIVILSLFISFVDTKYIYANRVLMDFILCFYNFKLFKEIIK